MLRGSAWVITCMVSPGARRSVISILNVCRCHCGPCAKLWTMPAEMRCALAAPSSRHEMWRRSHASLMRPFARRLAMSNQQKSNLVLPVKCSRCGPGPLTDWGVVCVRGKALTIRRKRLKFHRLQKLRYESDVFDY